MVETPGPPAAGDEAHRVLAALLLRTLGTSVLIAAGAVAALAWIERWEGAPNFGVATYLFWPMLVGAVALIVFATRFSSAEAGQSETASAESQ
jgi:sterol desaturase/sphingolipid hydroxylase (fatty acid hydroxylase superfamily)